MLVIEVVVKWPGTNEHAVDGIGDDKVDLCRKRRVEGMVGAARAWRLVSPGDKSTYQHERPVGQEIDVVALQLIFAPLRVKVVVKLVKN